MTISEQLKRLTATSRGKGRLGPAASRDLLPVAISQAVNSGSPSGGPSSLVGPLTEQVYSGTTFFSVTSSDGLFIVEFPSYTDYEDADSTILRFNHIDPDA